MIGDCRSRTCYSWSMCAACAEQLKILEAVSYATQIASSVNGKVKIAIKVHDANRRLRETRKAKAQALAAKDKEIQDLTAKVTLLEKTRRVRGDTTGASYVIAELENFSGNVAKVLKYLRDVRDKKVAEAKDNP
jgi:hypothetical protein